jgi:peroxiredoxin
MGVTLYLEAMMTDVFKPVRPGDRAPAFTLAAANRDGTVSLGDYQPKRAVLLGLFRGLHCPFCRRQVFQLGAVQPALAALGVETVAVMNTQPERARLYFRYHPTPVVVLADPEARTHRAFAVPSFEVDETVAAALAEARINPAGELSRPLAPLEANAVLNTLDGFELTEADQAIVQANPAQLTGHFLIDRNGIVRWATLEAEEGLSGIGKFPTPADLLGAARALVETG